MKKVFFTISLSVTLFEILIVTSSFAEELTITTYYPAPYGVYEELRAGEFYGYDSNYDRVSVSGISTGTNPIYYGVDPEAITSGIDPNETKDGSFLRQLYIGSGSDSIWPLDERVSLYVRNSSTSDWSVGTYSEARGNSSFGVLGMIQSGYNGGRAIYGENKSLGPGSHGVYGVTDSYDASSAGVYATVLLDPNVLSIPLYVDNPNAGQRAMVVNRGSVGIGTSSPTGILHVEGGNAINNANGTDITLNAQDSWGNTTPYNRTGGNILLMPGTSNSYYGNYGGVGINTNDPLGILDVRAPDANYGSNGADILLYSGRQGQTATRGGNIILMPGTFFGTTPYTGRAGRVGIGTADPQGTLDIRAYVQNSNAANGDNIYIYAQNGGVNGSTTGGHIKFYPGRGAGGSGSYGSVDIEGNLDVNNGTVLLGCEVVKVSSGGSTTYASCPAGKQVIGGGVNCPGYTLDASYPEQSNPPSGPYNRWRGRCNQNNLDVYAICANVGN